MIKVYETNEKSFLTNGLGTINPTRCVEVKKRSLNGWYLEVETSVKHKDILIKDNIVLAETKEKGMQPFKIGNPTITDRKIQFTANHIVFDTNQYLLADVRPTNLSAPAFLTWMNERTDTKSPFTVNSDITTKATRYFIRKTYLESLTETEESFNGSYDVDKFNIYLKSKVGNDNGTTILYGRDSQSLKIVEDWSTVCTKLLPVGPEELMLPEQYLIADIQYDTPYTRTVTFSIENSSDKTQAQLLAELRQMAKTYIEENKYPKVTYELVSNVQQDLGIGDIIHVKHPNVDLRTEVVEYTYDVISKKVKSLVFGNYVRDVKSVFKGITNSVKEALEQSTLNKETIQHQTDLINKLNKLGYVYIDDNEILILDKLPKENAKNVWRWGLGGLGFSKNGYAGPFETAITQDGVINASFITAGIIKGISLEGNTVKGGSIVGTSITGGTITGKTTINVGTDLTVGNNIYIGDDSPEGVDVKTIHLSEEQWITRTMTAARVGNIIINNTIKSGQVSIRNNSDSSRTWMNLDPEAIFIAIAPSQSGGSILNMLTLGKNGSTVTYPFASSSDERLKRNIQNIDLYKLIDEVNIQSFIFKRDDENKSRVGVIAQDLLGSEFRKFLLDKDNEGYYSVDYNVIFMANVQETQRVRKKIIDLENDYKKLTEDYKFLLKRVEKLEKKEGGE